MKALIIFFMYFLLCAKILAQSGVSIGIDTPSENAILHLSSHSKGILFPTYTVKLDEGSKEISNLFASPDVNDDGMLYYNEFSSSINYFQSKNNRWMDLRTFPSGAILIWTGKKNEIPNGWYLCDGKNNTPDLRGRFIVGYGEGDYSTVGNVGGAKMHKLSLSELPSHTHELIDPGHTHSSSARHSHNFSYYELISEVANQKSSTGNGGYNNIENFTTSSITLNSASIMISSSTSNTEILSSGNNEAHENRPKFYVVAFIMKE